MNLLNKIYLTKFKTKTNYSKSLKNYLKQELNKGHLNLKQLKYLYKNLYIKTFYIQQNIYPISEAMINGVPIEDIEKIAKQLVDAEGYTIFSTGGKNDKYNKLYCDLEYMLENYVKWKSECSPVALDKRINITCKLLKNAREENRNINESVYEYVDRNFKNHFDYNRPKYTQHTWNNLKHKDLNINVSDNKFVENEKDKTLS